MVVWHCPCKSRSPPGALSQTLVTKVTGVCSFLRLGAVGAACNRSPPGASSQTLVAFATGVFFGAIRKHRALRKRPDTPHRHPSKRWRRFTTAKLVMRRLRRARTPFDLLLRCLHRAQSLDPSVRWDDGEGTGTVRKESSSRCHARMQSPVIAYHAECR